jgi:predicted branched-subunit amino acid permease
MRLPPPDFRRGVGDVAPVLVGNVPFALIAGAAAVQADLSPAVAVGFSALVFAGASQLAAIELVAQGAPPAVVVLTAAVINVRMVMYSASLAPYFRELPTRVRAVCAYLLTDPAYALSLATFRDRDADVLWYYLGAASPIWVVWMVGTVVGALVGRGIPDSWGLGFAVPLVFLGLLAPTLRDRPSMLAGAVGGVVATLAAGVPLNLGLLVGATAGIAAGVLGERRVGVAGEGRA